MTEPTEEVPGTSYNPQYAPVNFDKDNGFVELIDEADVELSEDVDQDADGFAEDNDDHIVGGPLRHVNKGTDSHGNPLRAPEDAENSFGNRRWNRNPNSGERPQNTPWTVTKTPVSKRNAKRKGNS